MLQIMIEEDGRAENEKSASIRNVQFLDIGKLAVSSLTLTSTERQDGDAITQQQLPQQTVHVFHDHQNRYRRNDWQLELAANWLRHEFDNELNSTEMRLRLIDCFTSV